MKSLRIFILTLPSIFGLFNSGFTQQFNWRTLPNSYTAPNRMEDISFINSNTGWSITGGTILCKTTDGGNTWSNRTDTVNVGYRCIGFADSLNGWIGLIGNPIRTIIRTTDGGTNWILSLSSAAPDSNSVCGIWPVNKNIVYACGRYYGPARFYKSTNGGVNWTIKNMSTYAKGLVDCYFYSADSGFVIGQKANKKGVVLFTSDGGNSWVERYATNAGAQLGWKISFPTRNIGYISLYSEIAQNYFLKTTNGGVNWVEKSFPVLNYYQEGIGFVNENTGWIGGGSNATYKTVNGGDNWSLDNFGITVNRFRFINDTLGYSAGKRTYKFSRDTTVGITTVSTEIPERFDLKQNYPNPFNPGTKIRFDVAAPMAEVRLEIYNSLGQMVETLIDKKLASGTYEVEFSAANHPSGLYYYRLITDNYAEIKKMMLIK